jgi:hypothetical protein
MSHRVVYETFLLKALNKYLRIVSMFKRDFMAASQVQLHTLAIAPPVELEISHF